MRSIKSLFLLCLLLISTLGRAHELSLVEMNLYEFRPGAFQWAWATPPKDEKPLDDVFVVHWPEGCLSSEQVVQCPSDKGMKGMLEVEGLGNSYSALMFNVKWHDGNTRVYTITTAQPRVMLFGKANDEREGIEIAKAYTSLGVEHILTGWDHLCFVISLLLLVGYRKRLIATITCFTLAHSMTLQPPILPSCEGSLCLECGCMEPIQYRQGPEPRENRFHRSKQVFQHPRDHALGSLSQRVAQGIWMP